MPKKLTEQEKQIREYKKDKDIKIVIQCKCNAIYPLVILYNSMNCSCKRNIINKNKPNTRNCKVLWERKGD